jgi:hypothetical protein
MAIPSLPDDFKEFLKLLGSNGVEYLLIGGYAVNLHGYVRTTNDLDIMDQRESGKRRPHGARAAAIRVHPGGADPGPVSHTEQRDPHGAAAGPDRDSHLHFRVEFEACYAEKVMIQIEEMLVPVISLARLRENKAASGRTRDLADLENLP